MEAEAREQMGSSGDLVSRLKSRWKALLLVFLGVQVIVYYSYNKSRTDFVGGITSIQNDECTNTVQRGKTSLWEPPEIPVNLNNSNCSNVTQFTPWEIGAVTRLGVPIIRDCQKLRADPGTEMTRVDLIAQIRSWRCGKPWEEFALRFKTENCTEIIQEFSNLFYVSQVEREFPIAYILVVYTNAAQILRFLKSIYRPHNLYCIHPDARQGTEFSDYFKAVAKCIDNVFVVSKPVKVYYGHSSILDAQLNCMQDLMEHPTNWKYVINLSGKELPLKTNREIVESLVKLNGFSAVHLVGISSSIWKHRFTYECYVSESGKLLRSSNHLPHPPEGINIKKSVTYLAASRAFIHFLLSDPLSLEFHKYLSKVRSAEEHYYASLYVLPQAKGGKPPKSEKEVLMVNEAMWTPPMTNCPGGHVVHHVCILTAPDMHLVERYRTHEQRPVLFFNKYFLELDPTPMDCMEEQLVRTNMEEYLRDCI